MIWFFAIIGVSGLLFGLWCHNELKNALKINDKAMRLCKDAQESSEFWQSNYFQLLSDIEKAKGQLEVELKELTEDDEPVEGDEWKSSN